jgi:hypothetical protein
MTRFYKTGSAILLALALLPCLRCASIPAAAPELSSELGKRIDAIQISNIALLHSFFDLKKANVATFIQEKWVPILSEEVIKDPKFQELNKAVVAENTIEAQMKFASMLGAELQKKANQKRAELFMPLEDLEGRIEEELRNEYAQARAINNSITSFLISAAKVAENRERYLAQVGIKGESVDSAIDTVNDAVSELLAVADKAETTAEKTQRYLDKLKNIKELLLKKKED